MLFERFQAGDHRLDPGAGLFVLGQQLRAFASQLFVLVVQAAVLVGQLLRVRGQLFDAVGKGTQLGDRIGTVHSGTIGSHGAPVKAAPVLARISGPAAA